jgi:hypothetical protein
MKISRNNSVYEIWGEMTNCSWGFANYDGQEKQEEL